MKIVLRSFVLLVVGSLGVSPLAADDTPTALARRGVDDLLRRFWEGDEATGHIVNTWNGYPDSRRDPRGALWERAMMFLALENAGRAFHDPRYARLLQADWQRTKTVCPPGLLEACGAQSRSNWASDDAGWSALMYVSAYRVTGDHEALDRARGLIHHAFDRWLDDELGGGLWYNDQHSGKSLYQAALVLAALQVWQITGEPFFHDHALACYGWMETHLLRPDGLYWCTCTQKGPSGASRPNDIHEGGSVVFLGGNMAMAVLHARLYRITQDDTFLKRALRSADAVSSHIVTGDGIYINDRDAWTNGVFAGDWAREVLSLPGINPKDLGVMRATAASIAQRARTPEGDYGASWSGPAEGPGSAWFAKNSKPQQLMTSANSVNMLISAALTEK